MSGRFHLAIALFIAVLSGTTGGDDASSPGLRIDITGNWRDTPVFEPAIRTHEPALAEGELKQFQQSLTLPAGQYSLEFQYEPFWDREDGFALGKQFTDFDGLQINRQPYKLTFSPQPGQTEPFSAQCTFDVLAGQETVHLQFQWANTRMMRTWLISPQPLPPSRRYQAITPADGGEFLMAHGVPFLVRFMAWYNCNSRRGLDHGIIRPWQDGLSLDCGGAKVKTAHFLGMIHNIDIGNGSWYTPKGDHGYSHFAGDQAGEIVVHWTEGEPTTIPLIYGYNLWFSRPWDLIWCANWWWERHSAQNNDHILFGGIPAYRNVVRNALSLADGVRLMGAAACNTRFIFSVDFGNRAVQSIELRGSPEMHDYPLISGVTLETDSSFPTLTPLPAPGSDAPQIQPVTLDAIAGQTFQPALRELMHLLYTFVDEIPQLARPEIPEGYIGPRYDFRGQQNAIYAATYLYYNGPGNASLIADSGMGCASPVFPGFLCPYQQGMGVWFLSPPYFKSMAHWFVLYDRGCPGQFPGMGNAWSRGIGENLRECMAFGYDKFVNTYVDWLDQALLTEANPPHWNRQPGLPDFCTYKVMVGDIEERGSRENDGHGICMWGRYMMYHWLGRSPEWNENHWPATEAAADWIQWQLDTDTLRPGERKDVLFTESECAHASYDFYSSFNCLHGLKLSIRLAEQLGKTDKVEQWTRLYTRLRQGILDHLVDQTDFGPIWHTYPHCDWQDHAHKLAHIHLATEGDTYTPLQDYQTGKEAEYLQIDLNSYRFLMKEKNYNCLRMYGYGQGMMTQAALLLDQMADASAFIDMLLRHCYLPHFGRWASPEGIILHRSGKYYLPVNGYLGQDSHLADSTKAIRLMLGIDDNNPDHLRLVPRYPADWTSMAIDDYPVLTGSQRQTCSYTYERQPNQHIFTFNFKQPVDHLSVRLGPISENQTVTGAACNDLAVDWEKMQSGDSQWVWIHNLKGEQGKITLALDGK